MLSKDSAIISALQQENLNWLGNVPINKIADLRNADELTDLRELLGKEIRTIRDSSDEEFVGVWQQVSHNIDVALKKHSQEVSRLDREYRRTYKIDLTKLSITGAIGIASSLFQPSPWAFGTLSVIGVVASNTALGVYKIYLNKRREVETLRKKPIAILFDAKEQA